MSYREIRNPNPYGENIIVIDSDTDSDRTVTYNSGSVIDLTQEEPEVNSHAEGMRCVGRNFNPENNQWEQCTMTALRYAPYCNHHTPLYEDQSRLGPFQGVYVRGWSELANGFPARNDALPGDLPPNKYIGDYTIGTDLITRRQLRERYPGATRGEYVLTVGAGENARIYDADGPESRAQGFKVIASMVNDCLPGNERQGICKTNCRFDNNTGHLLSGASAKVDNEPPIPRGQELYAIYGNEYWSGKVLDTKTGKRTTGLPKQFWFRVNNAVEKN